MIRDETTAAAVSTASSSSSLLPVDLSISVSLSSHPSSDTALTVVLILFLLLFIATVILGNSLVISAIVTDERLRSVTNTFVASLAVADLLLGVTVLPFSSSNQVLRFWPFGGTWCSVWLAVDVWLSTASILNLCAISLDRYLAIGYSFHYPRLMSPQRARILVAAVWVAAFLICFPPLLGWRRSKPFVDEVNRTFDMAAPVSPADGERGLHAFLRFEEMTDESLSGPGTSADCEGDEEEEGDGEPHTLDRSAASLQDGPQCQLDSESGYVIYSACGSFWIPMCVMVFFYWRIYVTASRNSRALRRGFVVVQSVDTRGASGEGGSFHSDSMALRVHRGGGATGGGGSLSSKTASSRRASSRSTENRTNVPLRQRSLDFGPRQSDHPRGSSCANRKHLSRSKSADAEHSVRTGGHDSSKGRRDPKRPLKRVLSSTLFRADGFQARSHLHRLNKEKKAAKTIGIIVGCFVICWAPFFTVYLLEAFCDRCTSERVFAVFFWLGYFNSAINPFVYALCSRDFRTAFKKLLRCRRTHAGGHEALRRRTRTSEVSVLRRLASDNY